MRWSRSTPGRHHHALVAVDADDAGLGGVDRLATGKSRRGGESNKGYADHMTSQR
jgi:hypothetical protein